MFVLGRDGISRHVEVKNAERVLLERMGDSGAMPVTGQLNTR